MKGRLLLLSSVLAGSGAFAATPAPTSAAAAAAVSHTESQVESKQIASANAPNTAPAKEGVLGAGSGYVELMGGLGISKMTVGKSRLGVSNTESDWIAQSGNKWQSPFGHLGIGYVYALSDIKRGYVDTLTWFSSIEPMLSVYYSHLDAKGKVFRFNNPALYTANFSMPVRTTSLMLDVILNLVSYKRFSLFILGGAGEAWSTIKYSDAPNNNPAARPALNLTSRTQSNMAYEWGTGVAFAITPRIALSLEYLYAHIGNINTSGRGTLGGVPDKQIDAAGFSLRSQSGILNLHYALY